VLTAFLYEIPMPVQPMKTIAAVALGDSALTVNEIMMAGIFVSGVVFVLGTTKMMDSFNKLTPLAIVQGMQVGLGMLLARKGFLLAVYKSSSPTDVRGMLGTDGLLVTIIAMCATMYVTAPEYPAARNLGEAGRGESDGKNGNEPSKKRLRHYVPMALILVVTGLVIAMTKEGAFVGLTVGPARPKLFNASRSEAQTGIIKAGIPQLPLTTLNSVISICALSKELFPDTPATPSSVATSVGVMNLVGCWFGAMPSCHGAGGLAAQYAFGARGGSSIVFLGVCKLVIGLLFGSSLMHLLQHFPKTILGVMLFSSSLELIGMGLKTRPGWHQHQKYLVMITASVTIATKSTAIGFAAGIATHILMEFQRRIESGPISML
jgi:MFS superfamily sulfate permease-like transporter